jgi:5-methylcytosine-specific restriction protein A
MANKSKKYCASFPCPNLAVNGAYCLLHTPTPAEKTAEPFYLSVAWRQFRAWYISRHPLCEVCLIEGRPDTSAQMVDHIIEIADGGALTSEENAMSLCWKCHAIKTAEAKNHRLPKPNNRRRPQTRTY